jgi:hypothetical protein
MARRNVAKKTSEGIGLMIFKNKIEKICKWMCQKHLIFANNSEEDFWQRNIWI